MNEYEACYVFSPHESDDPPQRPSKRRKTETITKSHKDDLEASFVPLLRGKENIDVVQHRHQNFEIIWRPKEKFVDETIRLTNDDTIDQIVSYIHKQDLKESKGKLPTGLVTAGPESSSSIDYHSILERVNYNERAVLVQLASGLSPNLKTILKYINQHATSQVLIDDEDMDGFGAKNGRRLNYDLQILCDYGRSYSVRKVIIAFQDSEAFDGPLLSELIDVLSSWSDRIPFILLFSIATSVELFQSKLSRDPIRHLSGAEFQVKRIDFERIFKDIHHHELTLFLGSTISNLILQQHKDFIQSPTAFVQTVKYAYMTHFFANPLSFLLCEKPAAIPMQKEHYEAIRNLPSFRIYAQTMIDERNYDVVRDMFDDNEGLQRTVIQKLVSGRSALEAMLSALNILSKIQSCPTSKSNAAWSELYVQAMAGNLLDSQLLDGILASVKKLPSDVMEDLIISSTSDPALPPDLVTVFTSIKTDLTKLISTLSDTNSILRSAYDIHHSTLRTTVVAQKVSLSKNSSKLSSQDTAYTAIVDRVFDALANHMQHTLINPQKLFLNEILIYDFKSPHREVFTPNPRFAIERALSSPHDYLGCECCSSDQGAGLEASQPATAILYQLYLESGSVINTADLWEAFWTIVGGESVEDDEERERERALALFSRALAELKYLGMVKNSRKKADHVAKLAWQGL